jgi:hypothetical protein
VQERLVLFSFIFVWRQEVRVFKGVLFVLFLWALPVIAALADFGFAGFWEKKSKNEEK